MTYNLSIVVNQLSIKSFQKRIDDFKETEFYLRKLDNNNCLVSVKKSNDNYEYKLLNGLLILKNRIGSKSKYGVIYLTTNKFNKTSFATKLTIMNDDNYKEILIAIHLSKISMRNLSPHFLFVYKTFYCVDNIDKNVPSIIKKEHYYISVNELINGNLKQFLDLNLSFNFIFNALQQILIAILSFHYFTNGTYHHDCHYKNFLFIKIKSGGYFHYNLFGTDYYIKNMGYLWLIWDFGLAQDEPIYKLQRIKDYFRIIYFFDSSLSSSNKIIMDLAKYILSYEYNYQYYFGSSDMKFFQEIVFKKNLLKTNLSKSSKKINKIPYIINDF